MTTTTGKEKVKEAAEKICRLTGYGGVLHPDDIIPDIEEILASLADEVEGKKIEKNDDCNCDGCHETKIHNLALTEAAQIIRSYIQKS